MRTMFAAVIVSTVYLQGCTTMPEMSDLTKMSEAPEKVEVEAEQFTSYVGSVDSQVLTSTGDCLRSVGLSSENLVVECQASSKEVAVMATEKAPAPQQLARLSYDGTALFAFDSAELSSDGRRELSSLVGKLNGNADVGGIYVVGHADSVGATDYNQMLSESRAAAVRQFLQSSLKNVKVMTSGLGESAPVADNATSAGRQRNRRVEVKIDAVESKSVFE